MPWQHALSTLSLLSTLRLEPSVVSCGTAATACEKGFATRIMIRVY